MQLVQSADSWQRILVSTAGMLLIQAGGDQEIAATALLYRLLQKASRNPGPLVAAAAVTLTQLAAVQHAMNGVNAGAFHHHHADPGEAGPAGTAGTSGSARPAPG